ncbi:hypothetical protein ACFWBC_10270 [Streptomyces sp. NPDC059985]|uniref:hypothetical protein n=1 Tax=Streptomyces sp. NPDC059985 TaxID=3347025 RepID=UPI0036BDDAE9
MSIEAAEAAIPKPKPTPSLEVVPDLPVRSVGELGIAVTTVLVETWSVIRARHPDVPEAVVTMATALRESAVELAHFAPNRWAAREGDALHHEVFVTAESLKDGAEKVIGYLIHEAAHGLNKTRGEIGCSASQYHNKVFRDAAAELGLTQRTDVTEKWKKKYGFAGTKLSDEGKKAYADHIAALDEAIQAFRTPESTFMPSKGKGGKKQQEAGAAGEVGGGQEQDAPSRPEKEERNYIKAVCACDPPAVIRVSSRTLASRKILCGECMTSFAVPGATD